ncbi:MAG: insulinase family protein [Anaerolineae bacterium]|nr:insulinase family protein [Anaerolineae bacterium]
MTERTVLDNGMTILIKEMHHAPLASFWMWYRVGSGDERSGATGISHWVEHMLFQGTPQFPKGEMDRLVSRCGGMLNAVTSLDFTAYYEALPSNEIDLGFRIEADRMLNASLDPQDVESERTVIISERQGAENSPHFLLDEEVKAAAFRIHAYRQDTIGAMCDLQAMTRDDLWAHYRAYYAPDNAIAVLVGDVDAQHALDRLGELFGPIPLGPPIPLTRRPEPEQRGERRIVRQGEGDVAYLQVDYHIPEAAAPDFFPLLVMDAALTGPPRMASSGGAGTNRSSRLYKALVEAELATSVHGGSLVTRDPYVYELGATVRAGHTLGEVEDALSEVLDGIAGDSITEAELIKAIKQSKAQFAYAAERATNQAYWLGLAEMIAGYTWFETFIDRLSAVTIEDVGRVARTYLRASNRTVGWYVPDVNGDSPGAAARREPHG